MNQQQINPSQLLWLDLVHRIETPEGFEGLSEPEKRYFAVCLLEGEVYNGGLHQYFFNSSGNYYKYALLGLQEINALQSLKLLQDAKHAIFGDRPIPQITGKRRESIRQSDSNERFKLLNELDEQFGKDPDNLDFKITSYAKLNGLL